MRRITPIIIIVCMLLSGCGSSGSIYSNYRAIEDLQLVQTLGVDGAGGHIALTVSAGQQEGESSPLILSRSAGTLLDAMDAVQDYSTRGELFFSHAQYIVFGQDYAENGIAEILDFVERDVHMRLGTELFVMRAGDAGALITGPGDAGFDIADELAAVKRDTENRGDSHVYTFRETAAALSEYGAALICALRSAGTQGIVFPEQSSRVAVPDGYGILRGDSLVGYLDGSSAAAASLLAGSPGTGPRSVPDGTGGAVTLEVGGSADIRAEWNPDGSPAPLKIKADLTAVVSELETDRRTVMDDETLTALSDALSAAVADDIRAVLRTSQALDADFLALAGVLRRSDAKRFAALPDTWLQTLSFDIDVETKIAHSYDLGDPVQTEGGAA